MKNIQIITLALACGALLTGCKDWLTAPEPGVTLLSDFYTSKEAAIQNVTACYVPLMWEYNDTYYPEWFIGDVVSDDALKGGQNTNDMADVYDMENWKTISSNGLLRDFYRAQYQGIGRCNMALQYIPEMQTDTVFTASLKERLLGEAYYLRAYYYFRLLRVYGGVPITTAVIDSEKDWLRPRASVEEVFNLIVSDLKQANTYLWSVNTFVDDTTRTSKKGDATQLGRATKGAAQAMLLKTYLYMASPYWNKQISQNAADCYTAAKAWGDSVITSGDYALSGKYKDNFTLAGENNIESVFEIQYAEVAWGDYGEGNGYTAGSFTPILTRSRSSKIGGGWGFNHPTWNLYNEYEQGDPRRDVTILNPSETQMDNKVEEVYLGSPLLNRKYAMYDEDKEVGGGYGQWALHASRGPINNKQIRYADVLLMYAEACLGTGDEGTAKTYINKVRARVGLGEVGTYKISLNGADSIMPTTEQALRHERRMELAMEGHRWFDLVRWGGTKAHIEAYQATESEEVRGHLATFEEGKHEIFPIPYDEITLDPELEQNHGY